MKLLRLTKYGKNSQHIIYNKHQSKDPKKDFSEDNKEEGSEALWS